MAPPRAGVLARSASTADRRISRDDLFLGSKPRRGTASAMDRRISRDDLYLGTRPAAAAAAAASVAGSSDGGNSFSKRRNVVQMQRIATLEELSPSFQHLEPSSPPACASACRGIRESELVGEIQIGMALGSPAHPPASLKESIPPPGPASPETRWPARSASLSGAEIALAGAAASVTTTTPEVPAVPAVPLAPVVPVVPATPAAPAPTATPAAPAAAPTAAAPATTTATAPAPTSGPVHRSKTTRRKLFGLFGSRRHQEMPAPAKAVSATDHESSSPATPEQATSSKGQRTPPNRSGSKKHQPIVISTPEVPGASSTASTPREKHGRTRHYLRSKASEPIMSQKPGVTPHANAAAPAVTSPFLDIDIPDVRLERYSVMFGNLLQPKPAASNSSSAWQPASSLLARRQATLDRLKMINETWSQNDMEQDRDLLVEAAASGVDALLYPPPSLQRRATSPAKSPSFSLFPGRNGLRSPSDENVITPSAVGIAISSPRIRSNTMPAGVDSPQQPYFPQELRINPLRSNPTHPPAYVAPRRAAAAPAASHVPRFSYDGGSQASVIMESPTDIGFATSTPEAVPAASPAVATAPAAPAAPAAPEDGEVLQPHTFKAASAEPQWQAISPPSTASLSSARSAVSSSGSSTTGNDMAGGIGIAVGESLVPDGNSFPPAVEISIARQISISRQQREMLRPLQAAAAAAAAASSVSVNKVGKNCGSPDNTPTMSPTRSGTIVRLGRNERLQDTRSATPTLVLADTTMASGGTQNQHPETWTKGHQGHPSQHLSPGQMAQNRKSEQAIVEAA